MFLCGCRCLLLQDRRATVDTGLESDSGAKPRARMERYGEGTSVCFLTQLVESGPDAWMALASGATDTVGQMRTWCRLRAVMGVPHLVCPWRTAGSYGSRVRFEGDFLCRSRGALLPHGE